MHHVPNDEIMGLCMRTLYGKLAAYAKRKGCDTLFSDIRIISALPRLTVSF